MGTHSREKELRLILVADLLSLFVINDFARGLADVDVSSPFVWVCPKVGTLLLISMTRVLHILRMVKIFSYIGVFDLKFYIYY